MAILTRSTLAITNFVQASRKAAALAMELKQVSASMDALREEVLEQIGDGRTVKVDGALATLTPRVSQSVKRTCSDEEAVAFFRSHGMNVNTRTPEFIAPAAFSAAVKRGAVDPSLFEVSQEIGVNVI